MHATARSTPRAVVTKSSHSLGPSAKCDFQSYSAIQEDDDEEGGGDMRLDGVPNELAGHLFGDGDDGDDGDNGRNDGWEVDVGDDGDDGDNGDADGDGGDNGDADGDDGDDGDADGDDGDNGDAVYDSDGFDTAPTQALPVHLRHADEPRL
eukprot:COSAG02_NODE_552_length_20429_cov_28.014068_13_plen_151_part_00